MNIFVENEKADELVFIDTEFDDQKLIQIAMIYYRRIKTYDNISLYTIKGSCNVFIKAKVSYFFTKYTNITSEFLEEYGVSFEDAIKLLNSFTEEFSDDVLLIAHGAKQDLSLLTRAGVKLKRTSANTYCTYNNAKRILKRDNKLKLTDLCLESGNYITTCHDAFVDCKNLMNVFQYLKGIDN